MSEPIPATEPAPPPAAPDPELELQLLDLVPALEAVLMVADQPLDHLVLAEAVGHPPADVQHALEQLAASYDEQGRGFELRHVGGGWRYYTREAYAPAVERFVIGGQQARLTQAALETLAVVAYKQPISRGRISAIRAVNVDGVMRTLVTRGLVEEAGHRRRDRGGRLPHHELLHRAHGPRRPHRAARARARTCRPRGHARLRRCGRACLRPTRTGLIRLQKLLRSPGWQAGASARS
jgi:segregation and condensation protein B